MARDPASIRFNNPGAQYPGPSARRYGATGTEIIGGGHQIAVFPDAESGAAAQFDLLTRGYSNMSLRDALRKWSGGNSSDAYLSNVVRATGLSPDTVITDELLRSPQGITLARTMAQHEAGRPYPMTDDQWAAAHGRVFGSDDPTRLFDPGSVPSTVAATQPTPQEAPRAATSPIPQATPETAPTGNFSGLTPEQTMEIVRAALERDNPVNPLDEQPRRQTTDDEIPMPQLPQRRRVDLSRLRAALEARRTGRV